MIFGADIHSKRTDYVRDSFENLDEEFRCVMEPVEEIENLFEEAGLEIVERLCLPYWGYALERCKCQQLPVNVAYVLKLN